MEQVPLTDQQQEVVRLLEANASVRKIAALLNISTQRVYQHIDRLRALGVLK